MRESSVVRLRPGLGPTDPEFRRGAAIRREVHLQGDFRCAIYVSIAFLRLISSGPLQAQPSCPSRTPVGTSSSDLSAACSLSTGDWPLDGAAPEQGSSGQTSASERDWVRAWFRRVDQARASQPHFVSPIVTTHTMLVQQFRYDMSWQQDLAGGRRIMASREGWKSFRRHVSK